MRKLADAIPAAARGPYKVDAFCKLEQDDEIEPKIQEAKRRLAAAKASDQIRQKPGFQEFSIPDFDIDDLDKVLDLSLPDIEQEAVEKVQAHISKLGRAGEEWIGEGMPLIEKASADGDSEVCPFCGQETENSDIIEHYRGYFSEVYEQLKSDIRSSGIAVRNAHGGDIQSAFERSIRTAAQTHEFWKDFIELPIIDIDTAAIARTWSAAREAVLDELRAKMAAPLEAMSLSPDARNKIADYRKGIEEARQLSAKLLAVNDQLEIVREQAQADDLAALRDDLAKLVAQKARFDDKVAAQCDAYLEEKTAKAATETHRTEARAALDEYREQIFPAYEATINDYLRRFNATFRLGAVESVNNRTGSSASYCVVINQEHVEITAEDGPSFRNTLSAGDRNTLALAFFFASLEKDPDLENKIVVIDDPMTSLDEHRTLRTREEIMRLSGRVKQIIVLSHSKQFLCPLWDRADRNSSTAIRVNRAAAGSELVVWDVRNDSVSEHDKRHQLIRGYLFVADPAKEREVAAALRPTLEAFLRVAYPEHFPPGKLIGPFLGLCEQRLGTDGQILNAEDIAELRSLKDYGNLFHHDTNPAYQTAEINDAELGDFAGRVLVFGLRS